MSIKQRRIVYFDFIAVYDLDVEIGNTNHDIIIELRDLRAFRWHREIKLIRFPSKVRRCLKLSRPDRPIQ